MERVKAQGQRVRERLESLSGEQRIREVRGLGYLLGIELEVPASELQKHLLDRKILVGKSNEPNTIRLLPPLTVSDDEWEIFFEAMESFRS